MLGFFFIALTIFAIVKRKHPRRISGHASYPFNPLSSSSCCAPMPM
jgi:hypothetical protein